MRAPCIENTLNLLGYNLNDMSYCDGVMISRYEMYSCKIERQFSLLLSYRGKHFQM